MKRQDEARTVAPIDDVIDAYKRDVDRTLIRENLRKTPEQRLKDLEALLRLAEEARRRTG
jgi:hypothetical protein